VRGPAFPPFPRSLFRATLHPEPWRPFDARPFLRGINSIQLFNDGTRWWIVSVYWQAETPTLPLPPEYLPAS